MSPHLPLSSFLLAEMQRQVLELKQPSQARGKLVKQSTAQQSSKIYEPRGPADLRVSTISPKVG